MDEIQKSTTESVEDENLVALCRCNNCGSILIDHNPQVNARTYNPALADGELKQFTNLSGNGVSHDIIYFWGCPNCGTDDYLDDIQETELNDEKEPKEEHYVNEVEGVIISRSLLADYGYDPELPTGNQMRIIAKELLEYWGVSGGYKDALASTMQSMFDIRSNDK